MRADEEWPCHVALISGVLDLHFVQAPSTARRGNLALGSGQGQRGE